MAFSFFIHGFVTLVFRTRPLKAIIFMVWVLNAAQSENVETDVESRSFGGDE
jgi:hypothetical protein